VVLIFKGLTARRLYKSFGVIGLIFIPFQEARVDIIVFTFTSTVRVLPYDLRDTHKSCTGLLADLLYRVLLISYNRCGEDE
jgi:hypothetical protein